MSTLKTTSWCKVKRKTLEVFTRSWGVDYRIFRILSNGFLHRICATTREHSFLRILPL